MFLGGKKNQNCRLSSSPSRPQARARGAGHSPAHPPGGQRKAGHLVENANEINSTKAPTLNSEKGSRTTAQLKIKKRVAYDDSEASRKKPF